MTLKQDTIIHAYNITLIGNGNQICMNANGNRSKIIPESITNVWTIADKTIPQTIKDRLTPGRSDTSKSKLPGRIGMKWSMSLKSSTTKYFAIKRKLVK